VAQAEFTSLWFLVERDGELVACAIHWKEHGRRGWLKDIAVHASERGVLQPCERVGVELFEREPDAVAPLPVPPLLLVAQGWFLAAGVCLSLIAQIAEQIDYLRFMPPKTPENSRRWWTAVVLAGPGWVFFGAIKQVVGLFLAVYIIANVTDGATIANEPVHQFLEIYRNFMPPWLAMTLAVALVVISQIKINVTNAYSGSLAWTNSFTRVTKHYPGRLVFLGVNLLGDLAYAALDPRIRLGGA